MARVLRQARMARGMTCEELDARAGFSDRYAAKLEHPDTPSGKRGLQLSYMAEVWIKALGYRLVLVPDCVAETIAPVSLTMPDEASRPVALPPPARAPIRARPIASFRRIVRHAA